MNASHFFIIIAADALPAPDSHVSVGWLLLGGAALASAIGAVLYFIRREARMQEPEPETTVKGGPVLIHHEREYAELRVVDEVKTALRGHQAEIWEAINVLRRAVADVDKRVAEQSALRESNGARVSELSGEVRDLTRQVSRLAGIVDTKLEAKNK